jgi:hypothetical protein
MPRRHSPNGQQAALARERERQAIELRRAGATYEQIAAKLPPHTNDDGSPGKPVTPQAVAKMIKRVLTRTRKLTDGDAESVRQLEIERLDAMLLGLWSKARAGHEGAVDRVLKIMQRRAELLGLDAPTKAEVENHITGKDGGPVRVATVFDLTKLTREQLEALDGIYASQASDAAVTG